MKRVYFEPQIKLILDINTELLVGSSGGVTGSIDGDVQIDYGGVDEEGTIDPEAKKNSYSVWEERNSNVIYDIWNDDED